MIHHTQSKPHKATRMKTPRIVNYVVVYGVTSRHLVESGGTFEKLKGAKAAYNGLVLVENFKAKRLIRLQYLNKWAGADDIRTLAEVVA